MKKYRFNSKNKKYKSERIGFFTAFSVCIIAISLGLWSTYLSIGGLDSNLPEETQSTYPQSAGVPTEAVDSQVEGMVVNGRSSGADPSEDSARGGDGSSDSQGFNSDGDSQSVTDSSSETLAQPDVPDTGADIDSTDKLYTIHQVRSSLLYPVSSKRVSKEYSEQAVYSETLGDYRSHTGVDFKADIGEAVFSACEGIVEEIYEDNMYGNVIKITDGPYSVYYCGVGDDIAVKAGDFVDIGQVIAQVGEIPCESLDSPHIHMEVRVKGIYIDPMTVISNNE